MPWWRAERARRSATLTKLVISHNQSRFAGSNGARGFGRPEANAEHRLLPILVGVARPAREHALVKWEVITMSSGFLGELERELREWQLAGTTARFWWRDDDAVSDTPALRSLLALAEEIRTVVGLAVIPERADDALVNLVATAPCRVWQHGWRHSWHSHGEFGEGRDLESMMAEAQNGQLALDRMFGKAGWQRVFVPPWHALSVPFKMLLPSLGYLGLSAGCPLTRPLRTVAEVNAEIDVMNWTERKLHDYNKISKMLVEQLLLRRRGQTPLDAPIGLLTHHLAFDDEAWGFVGELLRFLGSHTAAEIIPADRLFGKRISRFPDPSRRECLPSPEQIGLGEVTVVVTSCGRQDLLEITLDSFLRHNTFPITEFIIVEDGDGSKNDALAEKYRGHPFRWFATDQKLGQVVAIDVAYQEVRTEFIFHCEDDWEFVEAGFVEKSLRILAHDSSVLQVWLRALDDTNGHPTLNYTLMAGELPYKLLRHRYDTRSGEWNGFSWNPGLRRRRDYRLLGSFRSLDPDGARNPWQVESYASRFYQQLGFYAAILADNNGSGYVRHIGEGRHVAVDSLGHQRTAAARDRNAQLLMARLATHPRFGCLEQDCGRGDDPGMEAVPEAQNCATALGQCAIEEELESLVNGSSCILHVGVGNSVLGQRFARRASMVMGTTLYGEEHDAAWKLNVNNYRVVRANKFCSDMDRIDGEFDFIIDNNPSTSSCCLFHFCRMLISYTELLKRDGGLFLTSQRGLSHVCSANDQNWILEWNDWALFGEFLRMPVLKVTDLVYSMQRRPDSGIISVSEMQARRRETELRAQMAQLRESLGSARAQAAKHEADARRALAESIALKSDAAAVSAQLEDVIASTSWRATKPLRSIGTQYPGLRSRTRRGLELIASAARLRLSIDRKQRTK